VMSVAFKLSFIASAPIHPQSPAAEGIVREKGLRSRSKILASHGK